MTLVESLHSGDPSVSVLLDSEYMDLQVPDEMSYAGLNDLQVVFGLHPSAIHVCSKTVHVCSCNTCTGG
jgi:hypothetical protein